MAFVQQSGGLNPLLYWSFACVVCYLVLPGLFTSVILKNNLFKTGFQWGESCRHLGIYGLFLAAILPVVYCVSFLDGFQETYPFLHFTPQTFSSMRFLVWEIAYLLQFIALEYFFRGFILFNLEPKMGKMAVLVAMLPYCMIHFGKPFPETIGSIIAGIVLGVMALKSRSVIPGIILHYCVAITMDLLSLRGKGII